MSDFTFESTDPGMDHFRQISLLKIRILLNDFLAEGGLNAFNDIINDTSQNDPSVCLRVSHNVHRNALEMARQLKNSKFPKSSVCDRTDMPLCYEYYTMLCPHHYNPEYGPTRTIRGFTYYIMQQLYIELQRTDSPGIEVMLQNALDKEIEIRTGRRNRRTAT
jgi:hypothetical protein